MRESNETNWYLNLRAHKYVPPFMWALKEDWHNLRETRITFIHWATYNPST